VSVLFTHASAVVDPLARASLEAALPCFREGRYEVAGHTDNVGDAAANQRLSEARAYAVVALLRTMGVEGNRLAAIGYGDTRPVADNATADGRARNRRVAFRALP
jgi:OOP family OmpA-OmpF porin